MPIQRVYKVVLKVTNPESGRQHTRVYKVSDGSLIEAVSQVLNEAMDTWKLTERSFEVVLVEQVGWEDG